MNIIPLLILSIFILSHGEGIKHKIIGNCELFENYNRTQLFYLKFLCVEHPTGNEFFNPAEDVVCLRHYGATYRLPKSEIGTIFFDSCLLPTIPMNFFKVYENVHTFNMPDLEVTTLRSSDFNGAKQLRKIFGKNNRIAKIPAHLFNDSVHLSEVDFSMNKINKIDAKAFVANSQMQVLNISFNEISELDSKTFQTLNKLTGVDLSHNSLKTLPKGTFYKLVKLQRLNLSHNVLASIDIGMFSTILSLKVLDLTGNKLKILDVGILSMQPKNLGLLLIGDNQLQTINGLTQSRVPNVRIVGIGSNPINCSEFKRIERLIGADRLDLSEEEAKCNFEEKDGDDDGANEVSGVSNDAFIKTSTISSDGTAEMADEPTIVEANVSTVPNPIDKKPKTNPKHKPMTKSVHSTMFHFFSDVTKIMYLISRKV